MDHFLTRLVARTLGARSGVEPLIPSIYANVTNRDDEGLDPSQDEWSESSHESLSVPQRPRSTGRPAHEKDPSFSGNKKNNPMKEMTPPVIEKEDLFPDIRQVREDPLQVEAKEMPSDENIASRIPDYKIKRAESAPLPSPETQMKEPDHFPQPKENNSSNPLSSDSRGESHRSGRVVRNASQTAVEATESNSRSNDGKQLGENSHILQTAPLQAIDEALLVPSRSTTPAPYALTQASPGPSWSPPDQVSTTGSSPPPTKVTIGRIEVRAVMRPEPRPPAAEPGPQKTDPAMSLENYLKQRDRNRI